MKPTVYISYNLPKEWLAKLETHCALIRHKKNAPPPRAEFLKKAKKADGVLAILNEKIDKEFFATCPRLRIIANYAIGYDNVDLAAAKKHNVPVSNTPGDFATVVAEFAMGMMLSLAKRFEAGDNFMHAGKYTHWDPLLLLGGDMKGKTIGIIGTGRIGSALVRIAQGGFDMKVLYNDVRRNPEIEKQYKAKKVPVNTLLKQADFVSLHVPLLPSTHHLIGKKELSLMKKTAILVNTSRGPVIDEKALVRALKKKQIAGAGIDVYEHEPAMSPGLGKLENAITTPHIASATESARRQMADIAIENLLDVLVRGKQPRNQVK